MSTKIMVKRNSITSLLDENNVVLDNKEDICDLIDSHFIRLYTSSNPRIESSRYFLNFSCPLISEIECATLAMDVTSEETVSAVMSMKPWKSLGLDGL